MYSTRKSGCVTMCALASMVIIMVICTFRFLATMIWIMTKRSRIPVAARSAYTMFLQRLRRFYVLSKKPVHNSHHAPRWVQHVFLSGFRHLSQGRHSQVDVVIFCKSSKSVCLRAWWEEIIAWEAYPALVLNVSFFGASLLFSPHWKRQFPLPSWLELEGCANHGATSSANSWR